jgi:hypothetical protein
VLVKTDPGAHPSFYTMGTGSFLGVKRQGRGFDHTPASSAEVEGRIELYYLLPLWDFVDFKVYLTFTFHMLIIGKPSNKFRTCTV